MMVFFLIECNLKVWKHKTLCNNTRYGKIDCHEFKLSLFEYESMSINIILRRLWVLVQDEGEKIDDEN